MLKCVLRTFVCCCAISASSSSLVGNDAQRVFNAGSEELRVIVSECNDRIKDITQRCIPQIRRLLAGGHQSEAAHLAFQCVTEIRETVRRSTIRIEVLCSRVINRLLELGAPNLARRFHDRCLKGQASISNAGQRAEHAIRSLFN
ncbi:MAG TPA: hypothetical protein PKD64_18335 [Pirellulaceae bacterium]|nr:hypothetical protein [Pirellulaceae bacterium]HMO94148.1 hypothetical protein [Pirellulaceae bacterium]HMP71163.1 hypothetical protein [Pirellulaceae bacterium]